MTRSPGGWRGSCLSLSASWASLVRTTLILSNNNNNHKNIAGNLLAIPILVSRKMSNVFNRTLAFLAFFDTAFIVLDVLESVRQYYEDNGGRVHDFHIRLFPHMLYPLQNIAMVASIYLTVVIAMERYRAVSKPLTSFIGDAEGGRWRRVFAYVGPVLVFSVMFNLPTFFEFYAEDVSGKKIQNAFIKLTAKPF